MVATVFAAFFMRFQYPSTGVFPISRFAELIGWGVFLAVGFPAGFRLSCLQAGTVVCDTGL